MEQAELLQIALHFLPEGSVSEIRPLGDGLINDTYKVTTADAAQPDYVMQHINTDVFENVDMLMQNIVAVTRHIRSKLEARGTDDIDRKVLHFIPDTTTGLYYYRDAQGKCWRLMVYIPDTITKTDVTPETSNDVGRAFGEFQSMLADIPEKLGETIPNFHNMEFRMKQLREAVRDDKAGRAAEMKDIIDAIEADAYEMCKGERLHREGRLPKRICHCDTKANNLLFDKAGNVLCVIDLDTVMPNFVFSDIGDFLRTAANSGAEDDKNLDNVNFKLDIFRAFTRGYLESAGGFLLPVEIENIPYAARLFPFMQTVRFLADYLNGDTYYKIQYPEHNKVRTYAQWKLYQSATAAEPEMKAFVEQCLAERK